LLVSVFIFNDSSKTLELTSCSISISDSTKELYTIPLTAKTNKVKVNDGIASYKLKILKSDYEEYTCILKNDSLKAKFHQPLIIVLRKIDALKIGLFAYYPFKGNTNDETKNKNHGINYGATSTLDKNNNTNSAYSLNGLGNYIKLPNPFDFKEASFSMWINVRSFPIWKYDTDPTNSLSTIFCSDNPNLKNGAYIVYASKKNGKNVVSIGVGGTLIIDSEIQQDKWYNISFTKDVNIVKVYIDGKLATTSPMDTRASVNGNPFAYIGTSRNASNRFFDGIIDEVCVYNRVLTADEIKLIVAN
jgi:hypothetical protein